MPALSLALLLLGPPEPRFELSWQAPEGCPAAAHVEGRIAELLASSPSVIGPMLRANAEVEYADGRFEVELSLHADEEALGVRALADPDCGELAEGVALIIALAVDPELLAGPGEDGGDEGVGGHGESSTRELEDHEALHWELRPPSREVEVAPPPAVPEPEPPRLHLGAYALAGVGLNALPGATARLGVGLLVSGDHWRIEVGPGGWLPHRIADARYQGWSVELAGCGVPRVGIVEFPLCARIELGAMIGESLLPEGRRAVAPWLAAAPGVGMIVRPRASEGMVGIVLRADAVLPLTRPAFATDEGALLVRIGFGAQILAGLELRMPAPRRVRKRTNAQKPAAVLDRASRGQLEMMPRRSAE